MSEAEELLEELPEENYTAGSGSAERHIVIGRDKYITVPEELKNIAVQFDCDVETVTFDCPALWDEHKLSEMTVYVNYVRADGKPGRKVCSKPVIDGDDPSIMHFNWTVSKYVTEVHGPIRFLVCIKDVDGEGNEKTAWHSHINEDMYVSEGMECDDEFEGAEKDIITDLLLRMEGVENVLDMEWVNATDERLDKLEDEKVGYDGGTITGDLTVQGAIVTPNAATAPEKVSIEGGYSSRQTANGLSVVDGAITRVKTIKGKTVKTTNLIPYPYPLETTTNNGITFTVAPDGSITINGTATENATFGLCGNATNLAGLKKGSTYTLGTFGVDGQYQYQLNYYENGTPVYCATSAPEQNKHTFTVGESWDGLYLYLVVLKGVTINNLICRPMLNEGSEALPYTPYFAGLKHAYIKSIKSTGKNLVNIPDFELTGSDGPSINLNLSGTVTISCRLTYSKLEHVAASAFLSFDVDGSKIYKALTDIASGSIFTCTVTGDKITKVNFLNWPGATGTVSNIMLNYGFTALPFEPYKEDTYELPEAVELGEWDEIDISAQKVIKRTKQIMFNGSEAWSLNVQASSSGWGNVYMRAIGQGALYSRVGVCSHYDTGVWDTDFTAGKGNVFATTADVVLFKTDGVQTLEEFKAYLAAQYAAGTPVTIDVRLSSETETEIDIPKYYTAYDKGSEMIIQGDADNSQWGAVPTVVQEYSVMLDPKATATKEFVLNALAEKMDKDGVVPAGGNETPSENAANVTSSIGGKPLTEIFEADGKTVKNATVTNSVKSKTSGTTYEVEVVDQDTYDALEAAGAWVPNTLYIVTENSEEA